MNKDDNAHKMFRESLGKFRKDSETAKRSHAGAGGGHGRDFIGSTPLASFVEHLDILPTLKAPGEFNGVTHLTARDEFGSTAPENAGNVVGAMVCSIDGKHHIADFPAQGCFAVNWLFANCAC